ncbi:hypothetical protein ACOSQ2_007061 [Xanthoceras sorbifolium]
MALGEYWERNAKRKLQVKKLCFPSVSVAIRPSLPRVIPQAIATHLRDQGSLYKNRDGDPNFDQ